MEPYEPKTVISPEHYDEYLLDLHRTLSATTENQDPPNPFSSVVEADDNIKVVVNDTNDLHYCIEHLEKKINENEIEYAIIGDPHTIGYSLEALERMMQTVSIDATFIKSKQWIIVMLNTSDKKLVIRNRKLRVEKN